MKKLAVIVLAIVLMMTSSVMAQDTIILPDVVVTCPETSLPPAVVLAARLYVAFRGNDDVLTIPTVQFVQTADGRAIQFSSVSLTCTSSPAEITLIDVSPSVGLNQSPPLPDNVAGIPESQSGYAVVLVHAANMRTCDRTTCTQVAVVNGGDRLVVLGRNDRGNWWLVQAGDYRGWIFEELVALRGDLTHVPIVATEGEVAPARVLIVSNGNPLLNNSDAVICTILGGQEYLLVGRNADDSWLEIVATCADGSTAQGWVDGQFAIIRNPGRVFVPITARP